MTTGETTFRDEPRTLPMSLDISVLVPTRNENENVGLLIDQINGAMENLGRTWELLFLDDSDDETPDTIRELQSRNLNISLFHREPGQRSGGLGGAVLAGIRYALGRVIVIMDADLQHPPQMIRELSTTVLSGKYDVAIASRYVSGASNAGLDGVKRRFASRLSVGFAHFLVPKTRGVRDPMSGFFAISRESLIVRNLRPHGFKILMELLARGNDLRIAEVPFQMNPRAGGDSKAGSREGVRFLRHTVRLLRARWSSSRISQNVLLQIPLAGILAIQTALSYRLIYRNTAFLDEATYLSAGHYELHVLLHGGPNMNFPTYFSGAPTIYPIIAALMDDIGGLHAARFLSLGFMLVATVLCYATAHRLWGRVAGWVAAGIFVTTQGTQFLGALATFDAMSLMLIALAAWIVVHYAASMKTSSMIYLAVPVMVFANAAKYASAIFDPVIILLAFFVMLNFHELRSAIRKAAAMLAAFVLLLTALLAIIPNSYLTGISSTTVNRPASIAPARMVLLESWEWVGAIACIALFAAAFALVMAWRHKSSWAFAGLIGTLAIAVLLAPANQARIHTLTSLSKHVTFGAWFGAITAGWLIHLVTTLKWNKAWRITAITLACLVFVVASVPLLIAGTRQADRLDDEWANSTVLISTLRPLVTNLNRPILMDDSSIGTYYLENKLPLPYWYNTFYFSYVVPGTKTRIVGPAAYRAAVDAGWFSVIALNWSTEQHIDNVVDAAIRASKQYVWVATIPQPDIYGTNGSFIIWRLKDPRS
jgi:glycosyltransferase involved in cell wall biosynthesis